MAKLKKLKLCNFKSFTEDKNGAEIQIAPITLLYGYNNTGKSSLLRSLIWWTSSWSHSVTQPIDLSCPALFGASFESLMSKGQGAPIQIMATICLDNGMEIDFDWKIRSIFETRSHFIEELHIQSSNQDKVSLTWVELDCKVGVFHYAITSKEVNTWVGEVCFSGLIPHVTELNQPDAVKDLNLWFTEIRSAISSESALWLSSQRQAPERAFDLQGRPAKMDYYGRGYMQWLAYDSMMNSNTETLISKVSRWYQESLGLVLQVEPTGKFFELTFSPIGMPAHRVNVVDSGQGIQEALPLITLLNIKKSKSTVVCIEEPESHLHPRLHAFFGNELIRASSEQPDTCFVLETHSENLLLSLQIALAEGRLSASDLAVYWVSQIEGRSSLTHIPFDQNGYPGKKWPREVFSEDAHQARQLLTLQNKSRGDL